MNEGAIITPQWPAPASVRAASTTRIGGVSSGAFSSLNLASLGCDTAGNVAANRERVSRALGLPRRWHWVRQVHGARVANAESLVDDDTEADAVIARAAGAVCAIRTADCLPVLLSDVDGRVVAAAHAGWRGLCDGVLEATVTAMAEPAARLLAWLGPSISAAHYEVGEEVRARFLAADRAAAGAFRATRPGHWLADLEALARMRLAASGVNAIHGGGRCTFADAGRFFSHRRDGITGRMASLIWITTRA